MRHHSFSTAIFAAGLLTGATAAQAANESWVSGTGTDAGTCPRTAPCRTFQFAHDQTNNNGAINVLTAGNYGPVTITKPISIVADGVEAVINTASDGGAGIFVQAGGGAVVSLRGLTIDMRGSINDAIAFVSGAALHVQNCVIRKASNGIGVSPTSGTRELYVADSVISDTTLGIFVQPSGSGGAILALDRVRVENAAFDGILRQGVFTTGSITATVRDSVSAGNALTGITADETAPGTTTVMVDRSASVNNGDAGIRSEGAGATIRIGDSTVSGNTLGLSTSGGGVIDSYGTNQVNGNGTDGTPTNVIGMK